MAYVVIPDSELTNTEAQLQGLEAELSELGFRFPGVRSYLPRLTNVRRSIATIRTKRPRIPTSVAKKAMTKANAEIVQSRITHVVKPVSLSSFKVFRDITGSETTYTTLKKGGELPWDEKFEVKGILATLAEPFYFYHSATALTSFNYANELFQGYFEFFIADSLKIEGHMTDVYAADPVTTMFRSLASAADHFDLILGFQDPAVRSKGYYALPDGPTLEKSAQFWVTITWDSTIDASNPFHLKMSLLGNRVRPIVRG